MVSKGAASVAHAACMALCYHRTIGSAATEGGYPILPERGREPSHVTAMISAASLHAGVTHQHLLHPRLGPADHGETNAGLRTSVGNQPSAMT